MHEIAPSSSMHDSSVQRCGADAESHVRVPLRLFRIAAGEAAGRHRADSLKNVPQGTPIEEIKRAADAFGLDFNFMKTVAKIESDFDPKNRTGSYIGLFQLSKQEFNKYGSGEITNARDNAIAAAYKFVNEATLFELDTHKYPNPSDLYLIHQQGWQGASEHVQHPERMAWQSMCATDEGKEKGERWCKRAIWGNTLPAIKHVWKSVDKMTSAAFVQMWRERVDSLYARYAAVDAEITRSDSAAFPIRRLVAAGGRPARPSPVLFGSSPAASNPDRPVRVGPTALEISQRRMGHSGLAGVHFSRTCLGFVGFFAGGGIREHHANVSGSR